MMSRTIMIMAGGTGGHVFPGLAVADHLRDLGWRVIWLGSPSGMEARLVPQRGYLMAPVQFSGLRGKGFMAALLLPMRLLRAFWQSLESLRLHKPNVVLGMGGYVSFPGGMMAVLLGKPLAVHEQNSIAGLTNRLLARVSDRALQAFPDALPNAQLTGNPVRADIVALPGPELRSAGRSGPLRLLVVGGSLGAQALNQTVPQALASMPQSLRPVVVHQSGAAHIEALRQAYRQAGVDAESVPFIDDMAAAYAGADIVMCRAGALTVSELACAGVASILVPYPHAVDDHQTGNARYLADQGAALLLPQSDLSAERLSALLGSLNRPQLLAMACRARALAQPGATAAVADACIEIAI